MTKWLIEKGIITDDELLMKLKQVQVVYERTKANR
jgi:hypothetical protein